MVERDGEVKEQHFSSILKLAYSDCIVDFNHVEWNIKSQGDYTVFSVRV